ncbi:MAG TPA: YkgJ family cysteine cluster protein [Pyrinomonadaceae bacterium]|jgi:Fe-S-cluster containining protein|nr:YkgJ family cysteine cluster protein [Pyrinomonadaceae bacterium]
MQDLVQITRYSRYEYYELMRRLIEREKTQIRKPQLPLDKLTKCLSENVVTDVAEPIPECTTCGICCVFAPIVPVSRGDSQQLSSYWDVTLDEDNSLVIDRVLPRRMENGYCANLDGEMGKHVACTIYNDRPKICHDFEAGSDRCHEYRRIYGIEPALSDEEIFASTGKLNELAQRPRIEFVRILLREMIYETEPLADGGLSRSKKTKLMIVAFLDDDIETPYVLHFYDPSEEIWFESDFLTLSLEQAREIIELRAEQVI